MPAQLKYGVVGAPGGRREGAGRKPDEFRQWVTGLATDPKKRKRLEKILNDAEDAEEKVTEQGVCVPVRASAQTYLQAVKLVWEYFKGKPGTEVNITFINDFVLRVGDVLNRHMPTDCPHCKKPLQLRPEIIRELETLSKDLAAVQ